VVRTLGDFALGVYAAPDYVARRGMPKSPAHLAQHTCVGFVMPRTGRVLPWSFMRGPASWTPPMSVRCAEDVTGLVTLARAGVGLVQTYDFLVQSEVQRGALVEVLDHYRGATRSFSLVYPAQPRPSPAASAFISHVLTLSER